MQQLFTCLWKLLRSERTHGLGALSVWNEIIPAPMEKLSAIVRYCCGINMIISISIFFAKNLKGTLTKKMKLSWTILMYKSIGRMCLDDFFSVRFLNCNNYFLNPAHSDICLSLWFCFFCCSWCIIIILRVCFLFTYITLIPLRSLYVLYYYIFIIYIL